MPQASDEDREWAREEFGSMDLAGPMSYLEDNGWVLTPEWEWIPPHEDITEKEYMCVNFLVDEWDFGGIKASRSTI